MSASALHALALWCLLGLCGCQDTERRVELHAVSMPPMSPLPQGTREQLQAQYARVAAIADTSDPDRAELGQAYGRLGLLFLAYDLLDAAEPALINARSLLPEDARWPYYLAHLHRLDGRVEQAAADYERAAGLQPGDVPTQVRLAEAYRDLGRSAEAEQHLQAALSRDSSCALAHFLLGQIAAGRGKTAAAVEHYEAALKLQPSATALHYPLSVAYRKLGDEGRSRRHLTQRGPRAVRLPDPFIVELERLKQGPGFNLARGSQLMRLGRVREAAASFEQAVAADPTDALAYLNLGAARAELGEQEKATEALQRAVRLDPSNSKAHYNLGVLRVRRGQSARAMEDFRAAITADARNNQAQLALAELLRERGHCREAVPHFEQVLMATPEYVEGRLHLALCHARIGGHQPARTLLEAGHEAFPEHPGLLDALARLLAASPDDGVRDGQRALQLAERLVATHRRPETMETLAMAYAELGHYRDAIQWQRDAIRAAESHAHAPLLDHLSSNLRLFEQARPCRAPFPELLYTM